MAYLNFHKILVSVVTKEDRNCQATYLFVSNSFFWCGFIFVSLGEAGLKFIGNLNIEKSKRKSSGLSNGLSS